MSWVSAEFWLIEGTVVFVAVLSKLAIDAYKMPKGGFFRPKNLYCAISDFFETLRYTCE